MKTHAIALAIAILEDLGKANINLDLQGFYATKA